jgi:hypothetical protein
MNRVLIFCILSFWSCTQCKNENSAPEIQTTGDKRVDEAFLTGLDSQEVIDHNPAETISEESGSEPAPVKKVTRSPREAKADSAYAAKLKESREKSPHKDKSCNEIMAQFSKVVEKAIQFKDLEILVREGGDVGKDAVFQACLRTDPDFKKEYNQLNQKLKSSFK